jgi:hypothetical protein
MLDHEPDRVVVHSLVAESAKHAVAVADKLCWIRVVCDVKQRAIANAVF